VPCAASRRARPATRTIGRLGVLDPEVRVEAFYAAVERQLLRRRSARGLDGPALWRDRYRAG
jgi:hypothetical protein